MEVKNRSDLEQFLETSMKRACGDISDDAKLTPEKNALKTYIIESNSGVKFLKKLGIKVKSLGDCLYLIKFEGATYYLDVIEDRFWILYSLQKSEISDKYVNKLIYLPESRLDNLWLTNSILKNLLGRYTIRGLAIRFNGFPSGDDQNNLSIESLGYVAYELIKAINNISERDLRNIKNKKIKESLKSLLKVKSYLRLSKAKIKFEDGENNEFVLEDVYYWGKFTAKGNDISKHFKIINSVLNEYKAKLDLIESSLIDINSGNLSNNAPISISFKKEIEDIDRFLSVILSEKKPFRLTGIKRKVDKDYYSVVGLDLHNGDKFEMDISKNWINLYLKKGSCGNTVLRLLANLQQIHDANTYLEINTTEEKIT